MADLTGRQQPTRMLALPKFQRCRGIRLHLGRYQVEFWFCPEGERIESHRHPHMESYVLALAGGMYWTVNGIMRYVWCPFRRRSSGRLGMAGHRLGPQDYHSATVTGRLGVFMVLERWNAPVKSAATDIEYQIPARGIHRGTSPVRDYRTAVKR